MNLYYKKLFFGIFISLAYISIGVFGLFQFGHMADEPMANCPYAENGFSLCDNVLDHVKNWYQFSKATFPPFSVLSFLILGIILYFLSKNFLNQNQYFHAWKYYLYSSRLFKYPNRIIEWLSLLENSPAF